MQVTFKFHSDFLTVCFEGFGQPFGEGVSAVGIDAHQGRKIESPPKQ